MNMTIIIVSLGIAIWLSFIMMAIILAIKPAVLKITEKFVCPKGSALIIQTAVYSYHRPGQRALEIYFRDETGKLQNGLLKVILIFWMILFVFSLPISFILVEVINHSINTVG